MSLTCLLFPSLFVFDFSPDELESAIRLVSASEFNVESFTTASATTLGRAELCERAAHHLAGSGRDASALFNTSSSTIILSMNGLKFDCRIDLATCTCTCTGGEGNNDQSCGSTTYTAIALRTVDSHARQTSRLHEGGRKRRISGRKGRCAT